MKTIAIIFTILLSASAITFANDKDSIRSSIDKITLYRQGALITRSTSANLNRGYNKLTIKDLPIGIDESSISIYTSSDALILSQRVEKNYSVIAPQMKQLNDTHRQIQDSIEWIQILIDVVSHQNNLLDQNKRLPEELSTFEVGALRSLHDYYGEQRHLNEKDIYNLKLRQRYLKEALNEIISQKAQKEKSSVKGETQITLELEVTGSTMTNIGIQYMDHKSGWSPSYDIRVDDLASDLSLVYKAKIYQYTGEEWKNTAITLSTAHPQRYYSVPELSPVYLRNHEEVDATVHAPQMIRKDKMATMEEQFDSPQSDEANDMGQYIPTNISSARATSVEYELGAKYNIASDQTGQTILLQRKNIAAQYQYIAVPKLHNYAILTATINDWESLQLIDGTANIFLENRFVGKTHLAGRSIENIYKLSLGEDQRVVLNRELQRGYEKTKFLGSNVVDTRQWKLSVHNQKSTPISVIIKDQIPVSQDSDIKVSLKEDGQAAVNREKGELSWTTSIAPRGKWIKSIKYEVKHPKNSSLYIE